MNLSFRSCIIGQDGTSSTEHLAKGNDNESMGLAKRQSWDSGVSPQLAWKGMASTDALCEPNNISTTSILDSCLTILDSPSPLAL